MPEDVVQASERARINVSLVAIPEVLLSTLSSIYDVFNCLSLISSFDDCVPKENPFRVEIVALEAGQTQTASGLPVLTQRSVGEIERTDIVIIPALLVGKGEWITDRYPDLVNWMTQMHAQGSMLCSSCSGVLLLAETGLLNGLEATIHWAYTETFRLNFPHVELHVEKVLVTAGDRQQFVMSGASASWQDLVLYLVARLAGPAVARAIARFMLLQWHEDGQAPYIIFSPPADHGDAAVLIAQEWLEEHFSVAKPVEEIVRRSDLAERSFKRRFTTATGYSPINYVQHLRIEAAKRQLERTDTSIDEISWHVGYEDSAFFRRLFRRITQITPGAYRRKFQLPNNFLTHKGKVGTLW